MQQRDIEPDKIEWMYKKRFKNFLLFRNEFALAIS